MNQKLINLKGVKIGPVRRWLAEALCVSGLIGVGLPLINGISYRHNRHDTPSISGQPACSVMCFSSPGGTFGYIGTLRSCRCRLRLERFIILNQSSCARSDTDVTAAARFSAPESKKKKKKVNKWLSGALERTVWGTHDVKSTDNSQGERGFGSKWCKLEQQSVFLSDSLAH